MPLKQVDKDCSHCGPARQQASIEHWDKIYSGTEESQLGWFEPEPALTLRLIDSSGISTNCRIMIAGAGSTLLADALLDRGFRNITVTDISQVSLDRLVQRTGEGRLKAIRCDLTEEGVLEDEELFDLWIDRAVLHFFIDQTDRNNYFSLIGKSVARSGYVILAEYSLEGADRCAGLPVKRYSREMMEEGLGRDFTFVSGFKHNFSNPSGIIKPYFYGLFRKKL